MTQETPTHHSSLVGGSTASRRLNCPGSYKREQVAPKSKGSAYAREGTALHEMMALILDKGMEPEDMLPFTHNQEAKGVEPAWSLTIEQDKWDELGRPALDMFDAFLDELEAETGAAASLMVEVSGEFPGIEGAFGTSDVPFRCGNIGGIWDWKFGRNYVGAKDNEQLLFYFAALRHKFPSFFDGVEIVRLCISQPQVNEEEPSVWDTTLEDVDNFILDLQDAIKEAQQPDAEIAKGPWCKYADCKTVCELHISAASRLGEKMASIEGKEVASTKEGPYLGDVPLANMGEFLSEAMELAEMAEDWAKHIAGITQEALEKGMKVPGYKIVAKRSSGRQWTVDDGAVVAKLRARGLKAADYYTKKVVTPPQAEKALKKLGKELPDDIVEVKPSSGFTLTYEGDPRPEAKTRTKKAAELGSALLNRLGK